MNDREYRVYLIKGKEKQLDMLEKVFSQIQYLGGVGSSRWIAIYCDGDGAVRLKITKADFTKLKQPEKGNLIYPRKEDYRKEPIFINYEGDSVFDLG